jgi:acetyl-CoA acetyltransferase
VLLTRLADARREGWPVLCRWVESTVVGCDPQWMGLGPVHALTALAQRCGRGNGDWDRVEINEAFAAQTLACVAELGLDPERVNTHGGAIALGHPIGASGARLVVHLARSIARGECRNGAAALCVGGGMGIACALEVV